MRNIYRLLFLIIIAFSFGCGSETIAEPATAVSTAAPALITQQPTAINTAVSTPPPPPTLRPPDTPTPASVASTPTTETTTPPPTVATSPTPPIEGLLFAPFAESINPLTGQALANPAILARRPLAVKITNAAVVRPQAGIGSADMIFEHLTEGGVTRFTAVFYSQLPDLAGPVRSARLIDLEIPNMLNAAFGFSGSEGRIKEMFRNALFFDDVISPDFGHGGFFRVEDLDAKAWDTMFTNPQNLQFLMEQRESYAPPIFDGGLVFHEQVINPSEPATRLELWYPATNATWFYSNGRYLRWSDGDPHLDANTNAQLAFDNVVIISANHVDTDIFEDTSGNPSIQIQIWGEGPVSVFRDGERINGRWQRNDPTHMLTFYDLEGNPLPLSPGTTFFHLVPIGFDRLEVTS